MHPFHKLLPAALLVAATPAFAQDAPASPITISGSAGLVSDYRFRGVSQSDEDMAVQAGLTATHESGLYAGVWGSNLSGWGTFGGSNMELDVYGGYKAKVGSGTLDVGLLWYMYPGGASKTDFAEPYVKLSGVVGPVTLTAGVAYAPKQEALGRWYSTGALYVAGTPDRPGKKNDNLYLSGDALAALPGTPVSLKAHVGYSDGNPGLGPNGTSVAPTGTYWDWMVGADTTYKNLTFGVSYVDTDIGFGSFGAQRIQPSFSKGQDGTGSIANGKVVFAVTAAF
ncbi:TorF family putative porin [Sphingomonas montana]|uniref:TorF family putative porin n=1 Tax=Sphingomonas montana TaxID=1843236 RepID=UPI00096C37A7|nr:TorF family putative porin [Sphingomonas montana]